MSLIPSWISDVKLIPDFDAIVKKPSAKSGIFVGPDDLPKSKEEKKTVYVFAEALLKIDRHQYDIDINDPIMPQELVEIKNNYIEAKKKKDEYWNNMQSKIAKQYFQLEEIEDELKAMNISVESFGQFRNRLFNDPNSGPINIWLTPEQMENDRLVALAHEYRIKAAQFYPIEKGFYEKVNKLVNETSRYSREFYNSKLNPKGNYTDRTFLIEAENVKKFYANDPNVDVKIISTYDKPDEIRNTLNEATENDDIVFFGHRGGMIFGVPNEDLSEFLKESKVQNCYLGSCAFGDEIKKFKESGKKIYFSPKKSWHGFNAYADTFVDAMYSRQGNQIVKPELGIDYSIMMPVGSIIGEVIEGTYEEPTYPLTEIITGEVLNRATRLMRRRDSIPQLKKGAFILPDDPPWMAKQDKTYTQPVINQLEMQKAIAERAAEEYFRNRAMNTGDLRQAGTPPKGEPEGDYGWYYKNMYGRELKPETWFDAVTIASLPFDLAALPALGGTVLRTVGAGARSGARALKGAVRPSAMNVSEADFLSDILKNKSVYEEANLNALERSLGKVEESLSRYKTEISPLEVEQRRRMGKVADEIAKAKEFNDFAKGLDVGELNKAADAVRRNEDFLMDFIDLSEDAGIEVTNVQAHKILDELIDKKLMPDAIKMAEQSGLEQYLKTMENYQILNTGKYYDPYDLSGWPNLQKVETRSKLLPEYPLDNRSVRVKEIIDTPKGTKVFTNEGLMLPYNKEGLLNERVIPFLRRGGFIPRNSILRTIK